VKFDELDEPVETPIFHRDSLKPGAVLHGPAIIDQFDSTTVVPPGVIAKVDEYRIIRLHLGENL
jgi:N-methylhydantoinase A